MCIALFVDFSPVFAFDFLSTSREVGWKSVSSMTYLVSSGMLNLNLVNFTTIHEQLQWLSKLID